MQESNLKNYALLHLIVFVWGFTGILGALISLEAIPLVFFRMWFAVFFLGGYFLITKQSFTIKPKTILVFSVSGLIIALHWITFFKAIKISNVSVAMVTLSTGAFFTALLEPIFFKRKIKTIEIILGLIVVFGLYIIFNFETKYMWGIIYALIAAFLSALFSVVNGILIQKHEPTTMSFYQLLFGVLIVSIYMLFTTGISLELFQMPISNWFYLVVLASICTAWAFSASVKLLRNLSPYTIMLTINLEPIYAIILALLIFGEKEQMQPQFYFGALLVLFVVLLNGVIKQSNKIKKKLQRKN